MHAAARLITGIQGYEHITPTLRGTLHWLPLSQRITFKITVMMSDCSVLYTLLLLVSDCDQTTTVTSSSHMHGPLVLAAGHSIRTAAPTVTITP